MAVRFDADAEDYSRVVSLGAQSQWSVSCWVKLSANRNSYTTVWNFDGGATTDYAYLQTANDGTTMAFHQDGTGALATRVMAVGVWYYFGVSVNGASGTMVSKALGDASFVVGTWSNGSASTVQTNLRIGESVFTGEWLNGAVSAFKWWGATLSQAQLQAEAEQFAPVRTSNLRAYYRFSGPSTVDNSGNGQTLSGGVGVTAEADPTLGPALRSNTFDGGAAGAAVTTANSGGASGDAFNAVTGSPQYSDAVAHRGLVATNAAAGSDTHIDWTGVTQPGNTICARTYLYRAGNQVDIGGVLALIGPSGIVSKTWMFADGFISIYTESATEQVVGSTVAIPVGQWTRIEWRYTIDGSGNGTVEMWIYLSADSSVHDDYVISPTVAWPGGKPQNVEFHIQCDATSQWYVDELAVADTKIGSAFPQIVVSAAMVTESDIARPITARKASPGAQVVESDTALSIRPAKARRVGQVVESNSAGSAPGLKVRALGQVVESNAAGPVQPAHRRHIGQVVEDDTATVVTPDAGDAISRVTEADFALPIRPVKVRQIGHVTETDSAGRAAAAHRSVLSRVVESAAAAALRGIKVGRIGQAVEADAAMRVGTGMAQQVIESDLAMPITPVMYRRRPLSAGTPRVAWGAGRVRSRWSAGQPRIAWSANSPRT